MKLNDFTYVILSLLYFITIIIANSLVVYLFIISLTCIMLWISNKFKFKLFIITLLFLLPTCLSLYWANVIFNVATSGDLALLLSVRIVAITVSSVMFASAINFEELLLYLMQHLRLPVVLGYSLLAAINAITNLKDEYNRIKNAHLMRYASKLKVYSPSILYPMLISASRYAFYTGLSMECRGLNSNKSFIHKTIPLTYKDTMIVAINIIIILVVFRIIAKIG